MPQLDQLSACPSCFEPLEEGDRFCGVCGADLSAEALGFARPGGGHQPTYPPAGAVAGAPASRPVPPPPPGFEEPPVPEPSAVSWAVRSQQPSAEGPLPADGLAPDPRVTRDDSPPTAPAGLMDPPVPPAFERPAGTSGREGPHGPGGPDGPDGPSGPHEPDGPDRPDGTEEPSEAEGAGVPGQPRESGTAPDLPIGSEDPTPPSGIDLGGGGGDEVPGEPEELTPRCVACGTGTIDRDGFCEHCGHKQPRERDHMEDELSGVAAASDRGLRHHRNEDYFTVIESTTSEGAPATIAVVCDGVSSATRPDEASAAAAEAAGSSLRGSVPGGTPARQAMHDALLAASEAVTVLAGEGPNEPLKNAPACTIVGALTADGILTVGWIGDSRAYWVPDDRAAPTVRLTEDDSWAAQMVAAGLMTEADAYADARAHAITGWLGADAYEVEPHTAAFRPEGPGVVVVCTDGLWNYAESAEEMAAAVPLDARTRPLHSARHLVGYALDGGGHDNVTVAVVPFPVPWERGPVPWDRGPAPWGTGPVPAEGEEQP